MDDRRDRWRIGTLAAQAAGQEDPLTGGVVGAIHPATTFVRAPDYARGEGTFVYGRDDDPTVKEAEAVLGALEGAADARLFASGMAAVAALARQTPPGGLLVVQSGIYYGTTVFTRRLAAAGIRIATFEADDLATLEAALADAGEAPAPPIVMAETPSNPWLSILDIGAAADVCRRRGARLAVDSTAATPVLTRPLEHGADIVLHSATKGLNGHSDVLAGALLARRTDDPLWQGISAERATAGAVLSPFSAYLLTRGMRTVALRVAAQSRNAMAVAAFLAAHPAVERVRYPGLPDHPGHAIARRQMTGGFGGLLSFDVADGEAALAVAARVGLVKRATSLGGVESLIEHRASVEDPATGMSPKLLRLSVGIEDADDILADLEAALSPLT